MMLDTLANGRVHGGSWLTESTSRKEAGGLSANAGRGSIPSLDGSEILPDVDD